MKRVAAFWSVGLRSDTPQYPRKK